MSRQYEDKDDYVDQIRLDSMYPTFRLLIKIVAFLLYLVGFLTILGALVVAAFGGGRGSTPLVTAIGGTVIGIVQIVVGKFFGEASVMLADIADSTLEFHSRRRSAPKERRENWSL